MASSDNADEFQVSLGNADNYPINLVRNEAFGHALERYRDRLRDARLFHAKSRSLRFVDIYEKDEAFSPSQNLDTSAELSRHLDEEDGAPYWRFVFLQSVSSRGALGCSREQLTLLLTYYQVMPTFLDFVLTFRTRARPIAHAIFRHENYLEENSDPAFRLENPSRSGTQIQHAFNLLSVERAGDRNELNQWPLRQVALYHSLDVQNGRCVWIFLKGNFEMGKRISMATKSHRHLKASAIDSLECSFIASLQVHVIAMEWCAENWAQYIDQLDEEIDNKSAGYKIAPVDEVMSSTNIASSFAKKSTIQTTASRRNTSDPASPVTASPVTARPLSGPTRSAGRSFGRSLSGLVQAIKRDSRIGRRFSNVVPGDTEKAPGAEPCEGDQDQNDGDRFGDDEDGLADLEKNVSFKEFQRLSLVTDELDQALRAIEQNRGVLKEIEQQYRQVTASSGFTTHIKSELCAGHIAAFFRKIRSIDRDLDIHHCRLKALCRTVENDKAMFNATLSYKSEKSSEFFALSAKMSSEKMEDYSQSMEEWTQNMHKIAVRTEQETVSMHIVTIFTLIFLPGTFLATFFSSGILHWDDGGALGYDWKLRKDGMKLFFAISFPMMALILAGWFALYLRARRKGGKRIQDAVAATLPSIEGKHPPLLSMVNSV